MRGFSQELVVIASVLLLSCTICCTACGGETPQEISLEYTVLPESEVPEHFLTEIKAQQGKAFQLSYEEDGWLYLAVSYGEKNSSGYSIQVEELYLVEGEVVLHTKLLPPKEGEITLPYFSSPYLVIKTETPGTLSRERVPKREGITISCGCCSYFLTLGAKYGILHT